MTFGQVLDAFRDGKNIRRKGWRQEYFINNTSYLDVIYPPDILEHDWEVVGEENV